MLNAARMQPALRLACRSRRTAVRCLSSAPADSYTLNISKCVDKAHEGKSLSEIITLPPGALQGLKAGKADAMLAAFNIKTIKDLGSWKHFRAAKAIAVLAKTEVAGARPAGALSNVNGIVDQAWESKSLCEILEAPPSALQGLAPWTDTALADLKIRSVGALAKWKYCSWAEALVTLAEYEREPTNSGSFGSR